MKQETKNEENKTEKKQKVIRKISLLQKRVIVETVYDELNEKTHYLISLNGDIKRHSSFTINDIKYIPPKGTSGLFSNKDLLLPTKVSDYESNEELFKQIRKFIHRYVDISKEFEIISTSFVLLTWVYDKFDAVPYLRVIGDFNSGKTTYLRTMQAICYKASYLGGASSVAGIYRKADQLRGILILDEADFRSSGKYDKVIKVLNQGYSKGSPVVLVDTTNNVFEPRTFQVFSPKIIATRERYQDEALESRCITEILGRAKIRNDIKQAFTNEFYEEAEKIRNKLLKYRFTNRLTEFLYKNTAVDESINSRSKQIFHPLIAVAPSDEIVSALEKASVIHSNGLKNIVRNRDEYEVLLALLTAYKTNDCPITGEINKIHSEHLDTDEEWYSNKRIGGILTRKMLLKKNRTSKGWVIPKAENKNRLEFLKQRYEITSKTLKEYADRMYEVHIGNDDDLSENVMNETNPF